MARPMQGTNAIYTTNGAMEATPITNFSQIEGDPLFKITNDFDSPNLVNGLSVNRAILSSREETYIPAYTSTTRYTFDFYLTNWTKTKDIFINLPVTCGLQENVLGGSYDFSRNGQTTPYKYGQAGAATNQYVNMTYSWRNYCVPYGAITRLFNKIEVKQGNLFNLLSSYESQQECLAINALNWTVGMGSNLERYKSLIGDPFTLSNIGNFSKQVYDQFKAEMGDPFYSKPEASSPYIDLYQNPSTFLKNFDCLLFKAPIDKQNDPISWYIQDMGYQEKVLRIPLAALVPAYQTDMMLPPSTRLNITLDMPIVTPEFYQKYPLNPNNDDFSNFGNFNCLAFPTIIYETKPQGTAPDVKSTVVPKEYLPSFGTKFYNFNMNDSVAGLFMGCNSTRKPAIIVTGVILDNTIAQALSNTRLYQPIILNNEKLRTFTEKLNKGETMKNFQLQPNQNMPQVLYFGFINTSTMGVIETKKYATPNGLNFRTNYETTGFTNAVGVFQGDPFYLPIRKFKISLGQSPYMEFDNTIIDASYGPLSVPSQYTNDLYGTHKDFGKLSSTGFLDDALSMSYWNRTINSKEANKYQNYKNNLCISTGCPGFNTYFKVMLIPEAIQRGSITGDYQSHNVSIKIDFDNQSPYWAAQQELVGNDTYIQVVMQEISQFRITADGKVDEITWPSVLIAGRGGDPQVVQGNPPNGSRQ